MFPEYVVFHNEKLAHMIPPHTVPWTPALRNAPTVPGGSDPLLVGSTEDIALTHTKFRAFTPEGASPANGWPCFIFFHGGMSAATFAFFLTYILLTSQADGRLATSTQRIHFPPTCASVRQLLCG